MHISLEKPVTVKNSLTKLIDAYTMYFLCIYNESEKSTSTILSGILVILATATIAASNIVQPAKAAYGNDVIKPNAQTGTWGSQVSAAAQDGSGHGIADFRANGLKQDGHGEYLRRAR